ncbi:MAG: hypothetical protein RL742_972, partial [Bacteroidota bacterium]
MRFLYFFAGNCLAGSLSDKNGFIFVRQRAGYV